MAIDDRQDLVLKKGATETYLLTINDELGARVDLTGSRVKFTVKDDINSATEDIVKDSTNGVSEVEFLTQAGATLGQVEIKLLASDSSSLNAGEYVYDVWLELATGEKKPVICVSSFFILQSVTSI